MKYTLVGMEIALEPIESFRLNMKTFDCGVTLYYSLTQYCGSRGWQVRNSGKMCDRPAQLWQRQLVLLFGRPYQPGPVDVSRSVRLQSRERVSPMHPNGHIVYTNTFARITGV